MSDTVARLNAALDGRYTIERELGEGGMATVYLADDLKHERKVALKVLKPELAAVVGAERFLAEIKTTANLQHPNILPLHDSGEADGFLFYVMPYVEGDTLKDRLDREHQLPVTDAVQIATDIGEALAYAHRQGVIHRDIKPANVLLLEGKPVISDFGIALAVGAAGGGRLTETGLSLGTPHYMSPEQATGDQAVGSATDTYALGSVLYEMLVGDPPYAGSTAQAVLGKIIAGKPVSATDERPSIPANVDAAVRKALEKLPADRFTSAQEFTRALDDPGFRYGESVGVGALHSGAVWKRVSVATTALAIVFAAITVWALRGSVAGEPPPPSPLTLTLTPPASVDINAGWGLAIAPDERSIVFSAGQGRGLFRRDLDRREAVPIPGTDSAWKPFFSPDGASIGFFDDTENMLKRIRLDGSGAQTLGPVPPTARSGGWSADGTIVFSSSGLGGLSRIAETGGDIHAVAGNTGGVYWLDLLPGAEAVVGGQREGQIVVVHLETGEDEVLFPGTTPRYVSGHLVYWREDALWAVPFDLERLEATGPAALVVQGVLGGRNGYAHFDITENLLVYRRAGSAGGGNLPVWVDRQGNREALAMEPSQYAWPRISPNGQRVALVRVDQGNADIWVLELESGARYPPHIRLGTGLGTRLEPRWGTRGFPVGKRRSEESLLA